VEVKESAAARCRRRSQQRPAVALPSGRRIEIGREFDSPLWCSAGLLRAVGMLGWGPATRIYLAAGATTCARGFEASTVWRRRLLCDPLSGHVFCSPTRKGIA